MLTKYIPPISVLTPWGFYTPLEFLDKMDAIREHDWNEFSKMYDWYRENRSCFYEQ